MPASAAEADHDARTRRTLNVQHIARDRNLVEVDAGRAVHVAALHGGKNTGIRKIVGVDHGIAAKRIGMVNIGVKHVIVVIVGRNGCYRPIIFGKQAVIVKAVSRIVRTAGVVYFHGKQAFKVKVIAVRLDRPIRVVEADEIPVLVCFVDDVLNVVIGGLENRAGIRKLFRVLAVRHMFGVKADMFVLIRVFGVQIQVAAF